MVTQKYKDMLQKKSVIRTLSEFATKRGQEIGYENVFDYSFRKSIRSCCAGLHRQYYSPTSDKDIERASRLQPECRTAFI